ALARLLYHLMLGKVDAATFDPNWNFTRELGVSDPIAFVQEVIDSGQVDARIEALKPQLGFYRELKAAYAREREIGAAGGWKALSAGPALKPGMRDSRVPALRERLAAEGDLGAAGAAGEDTFDPALEAALRAFQERHGLDSDGALGAGTLAELNVPVASRL